MKKTQEEIQKLRKNLPFAYSKIVKARLEAKGLSYSQETIKKVANGVRSNAYIDLELSALALEYSKDHDKVKKIIKKLQK